MKPSLMRWAAILAVIFTIALASAGGAQISSSASVNFEVQSYEQDSISGAPYLQCELQVDPDTVEQTDLIVRVDSVLDSTTVRLSIQGQQGTSHYDPINDTLTVSTTVQQWFPWTGGVHDSLWSVQLDNTRPLTEGESFRLNLTPVSPPVHGQVVTNTTALTANNDTIFFPAVRSSGEHMVFLVTATANQADSCNFGFGIRTRDGAGWAGGPDGRLTVLDSVHVIPGQTARVDWDVPPLVGNIEPAVFGVANTDTVTVSRIKILRQSK